MPELPEVETIRRDLVKKILGKVFRKVEIKVDKLVYPKNSFFKLKIRGLKILDIRRRAKILIFKLSKNLVLLIHLKLTGQLIYRDKRGGLTGGGHPIRQNLKELPNKFSHVIFEFTDGSYLFFNDLRKFGWIKLMSEKDEIKELDNFGLEPLSQEFTPERLASIFFRRPRTRVKQLLMDQKQIAGLGNIYADESCFMAGVRPTRLVGTLREEEVRKICRSISHLLKLALSKRGTSVDSYVDAFGAPGGFGKYLKVYGRTGKKCFRCGSLIKRLKIGGRGTHFCPKCQK